MTCWFRDWSDADKDSFKILYVESCRAMFFVSSRIMFIHTNINIHQARPNLEKVSLNQNKSNKDYTNVGILNMVSELRHPDFKENAQGVQAELPRRTLHT